MSGENVLLCMYHLILSASWCGVEQVDREAGVAAAAAAVVAVCARHTKARLAAVAGLLLVAGVVRSGMCVEAEATAETEAGAEAEAEAATTAAARLAATAEIGPGSRGLHATVAAAKCLVAVVIPGVALAVDRLLPRASRGRASRRR